MATNGVPVITEDHPALNTPEASERTQFPVVDIDGKVTLIREYSNLPPDTQKAVVELWGCKDTDRQFSARQAATRLANCGRHGSVWRRCKKHKRANAHRHTCHLWICHYCGKAHNRLRCWLRSRDPLVATTPQVGLELISARGSNVKGAATKLAQYFNRRGISSFRHPVIDIWSPTERVRMVFNTRFMGYSDTLAIVRELLGPGFSIQFKRDPDPIQILKWIFAATQPVLDHCGTARIDAFLSVPYRARLHFSCGPFYSKVKTHDDLPDQFSEEKEHDPKALCNCGECDGVMETIPFNERHIQTVEAIQAQYEYVEWSSCYDPFRVKRMSGLTSNSDAFYGIPPTVDAVVTELRT